MSSLAALAISGLGLLLLASAGPVYRLGAELPTAFTLLRWGAYVGLAGALAGLVAGVLAYRRDKRLSAGIAAVAVIVGLVTVAIPYSWQRRAQSVPRIHDISTDLENPPAFTAIVPLRADAPNSLDRPPIVAAQQREGYADIQPLTMTATKTEAFARALGAARDMGWDVVNADEAGGVIEATDTTRWFGFKDDVVVRITPWGAGTRIDVRSVSRVGLSDVGTNARRIREFLDRLEQ